MKIETRYLRAMLLFVANNDIRYYLNGVHIKGDRMVATNGHCLTVCRLKEDSGLDVIIPSKHIAVALQLTNRMPKGIQPTIEITADRIGDVFYKPIVGIFPDFNKVIPKKFDSMDVKKICVNPSYFAVFEKMGRLFFHQEAAISIKAMDERSAIIVHVSGCDDFFSLVMPMRFEGADFFPNWLFDSQP
jgi:hypothetical protein